MTSINEYQADQPDQDSELTNTEQFQVVDNRLPEYLFIHRKFEWSNLSGKAHRIYCHLVARANEAYRAWPSIETIAKYCRLNEVTVRSAIAELCSYNFLTPKKRQHKTTIYTLNPASKWLPPPGNYWGELKNPNSETRMFENTVQKSRTSSFDVPIVKRGESIGTQLIGTQVQEEVPSLCVSLPNSQKSENQEADRVVSLEEKNLPSATELPPEPPHFYHQAQALKWRERQVALGADWTEEETLRAFNELEKFRHPLTGRWRIGKMEITDFGLTLSERIRKNREFQGKNSHAARAGFVSLGCLRIQMETLDKVLAEHPANSNSGVYDSFHEATPAEEQDYKAKKGLKQRLVQQIINGGYAT